MLATVPYEFKEDLAVEPNSASSFKTSSMFGVLHTWPSQTEKIVLSPCSENSAADILTWWLLLSIAVKG